MNVETVKSLVDELGSIPVPFIVDIITNETPDYNGLMTLVKSAEIDSMRNPGDPSVNYCLAMLYVKMPGEIPLNFREEIEREKLRVEDREYLMNMSTDINVLVGNMGHNPDWETRLRAANDYIRRANVMSYLYSDNATRATLNFDRALVKSRDNPEYKNLRNALVWIFALDERLYGGLSFIAHTHRDQFLD